MTAVLLSTTALSRRALTSGHRPGASRWRWASVALAVTLAGCVVRTAPDAGHAGHETAVVPGIRIIRAEDAAERGLQGKPFSFPFGDNQDGTKLVLDFLAEAKQTGAQAVSDIRIILHTARRGQPMACETALRPFSKDYSYTVPQQRPGRTETRQVLKPVTKTVTEQEYRCQMVSRPVTRYETTYQSQYDYISKSYRTVPQTRSVTRYEYKNECHYQPVTRSVTRYEYQTETHYIPPKVEYISAHYTDFNLIESRPRCQEAQPPDGPLPHRITGTIYP